MEHCSSQPANKPQLRVTGSDPLGPFSCPDLHSDILTQPSLSLSTSSSSLATKRRYQTLHPTTVDSALLFHSERRSGLTSNISESGNQNQRCPGPCWRLSLLSALLSLFYILFLSGECYKWSSRPQPHQRKHCDSSTLWGPGERQILNLLLSNLKWRQFFL